MHRQHPGQRVYHWHSILPMPSTVCQYDHCVSICTTPKAAVLACVQLPIALCRLQVDQPKNSLHSK